MTEPGIYVRDVHALERLTGTIGTSGQAMSNIDQQVSSYLSSVEATLERQLEYIRGKLQEAKAKLEEAESAANACHAMQVCIEGIIVPTCIPEEAAVMAAQAEVADWTRRHVEGTRIFAECQREIKEYQSSGGGHGLIATMSEKQTPDATRQLRECIEKLQDILAFDVVAKDEMTLDSTPATHSQSPSDKDRVHALKDQFRL